MIPFRLSTASQANPYLKEVGDDGLANLKWLERYAGEYLQAGSILLLGGASITDFRLRVAQSHARSDMRPSLWSHVAILTQPHGQTWAISEVSLIPPHGFGDVPPCNASQENTLTHYDATDLWPNIALISFPVPSEQVTEGMRRLAMDRGIVDLGALLIPWLAFVWGAGSAANPLLQDRGIPSAVYAETVIGIVGLELTPGLSSQSNCPETIWQAAKWWHQFYAQVDGEGQLPRGVYTTRQRAAAAIF